MNNNFSGKLVKVLFDFMEHTKTIPILLMYSPEAIMDNEDVDAFYRVINRTNSEFKNMLDKLNEEVKKEKQKSKVRKVISTLENAKGKISLILHSRGGFIEPAYQMVKIVRNIFSEYFVYIPREAKSAATLLALGADRIYLTQIGELGPIDPIVSHPYDHTLMIPARAVKDFLERTLPNLIKTYGDQVADYMLKIDYAHVGFCIQSTNSAKEYAKRVLIKYGLKSIKSEEERKRRAEEIINSLMSYPVHDFVIDYEEAKKIGLNVELVGDTVEQRLWDIYYLAKKMLKEKQVIIRSPVYEEFIPKPRISVW